MATRKTICLLLAFSAATSAFSVSHVPQNRGRKLFGGYRIVPKVCQPTNPSSIKSNDPPICMFNYECSRRKGEVVGACMDGFLFGACCQLPPKQSEEIILEKSPGPSSLLNPQEIDHVPDIPILLNPDGTPVGITLTESSIKYQASSVSNHLSDATNSYTKVSTFNPSSTTVRPLDNIKTKDSSENAEKPQLIGDQAILSQLEKNFSTLLGQQQVLDDLRLPTLLTHSGSNNDIQDHQDNAAVSPVTTLLSPDQIMQIADPVDQLPALFSHGIGSNNHSGPDTILLNENGTALNETNNPDEHFKPSTDNSISTLEKLGVSSPFSSSVVTNEEKLTYKIPTSTTNLFSSSLKKSTTKAPIITQQYAYYEKLSSHNQPNFQSITSISEKATSVTEKRVTSSLKSSSSFETTTPMTSSTIKKNGLVRVPTISHTANKKDDIVDSEELAIHHIISILNDTSPNSNTKTTQKDHATTSSVHKWVSIDETSKPAFSKLSSRKPVPTTTEHFPYTFYKPGHSSTYYYYSTSASTESSLGANYVPAASSSNSYVSKSPVVTQTSTFQDSNIYSYSTRPTTNPPAPTVIVLGPLGTEFTTVATQKTPTWKPVSNLNKIADVTAKPSNITKKPLVSTTITHNISTIISSTNNNHVVSNSYISVNLKDGTSTKPSTIKDANTETTATNHDNSYYYQTSGFTKKPSTIWTTISTWTNKPSFHLKPSNSNFLWPDNYTPTNTLIFKKPSEESELVTKAPQLSTVLPCDEETAAPNDLVNFPPVRHPELNMSAVSQQEKPTIVETFNSTGYPGHEILSENEIPTPTFIEDDVLTNKVDVFVNKIVESLQGNFQDLKDVVYNRKNVTIIPSLGSITKRPSSGSGTTKKPISRPIATTKRPIGTKRPTIRPGAQKPGSDRPTTVKKPTTILTTKKPPTTSKRPKPTRRPTFATLSTEAIVVQNEETSTSTSVQTTADLTTIIPPSDFHTACGLRPQMKSGRIVGGKGARFGEWPWQVLVREATWLGLFTKNKCGGVLITDKYVITAAHCQPGFLASLVAVFGEYDISGELESKRSITKNVRRVILNRGYDPATFENDLALLELESPVQFDSHIVPICMPEDSADFTGRMATVTGWGRLKYNGGVPSVLQEVQVPIMENAVCQEMFQTAGHSKLILDSFLCAGYANGQKDSCEGDSGGPLTIQRPDGRWILVGTVSHGIKCAAPYLPGVYMRTTFFKPWLHSITGV